MSDWNRSSVDWLASRDRGALVMDEPKRRPRRNLRRIKIKHGPAAFVRTCPECGADLDDTTTTADGHHPTYCPHCDRESVGYTLRDARPDLIDAALFYLRAAREALTGAGAPAAADYVRRALKSTEGAKRHAQGRRNR